MPKKKQSKAGSKEPPAPSSQKKQSLAGSKEPLAPSTNPSTTSTKNDENRVTDNTNAVSKPPPPQDEGSPTAQAKITPPTSPEVSHADVTPKALSTTKFVNVETQAAVQKGPWKVASKKT